MDGIKEGLDIFRSHLLFATIGGLIRGLRHSIDQLEIHTENLNPPMLKDFGHSILEKLEQLILKAKKSPEQLSHGSQETDPTDEVIIKSFEDDMERYKKNHESDSCDRKQLEELEGRYWVFFLEIFKFQRARFQMWAKMVLLFESSKNSLDQKMQESDPIFNHGYQTSFRDIFREICDALKESKLIYGT